MNPILNIDSYKFSHWLQYPRDVKFISAYIESRGGRWNRLLFYGLQAFLMRYLSQKITRENIDEAREFAALHGMPFNENDWLYILEKYDGALPVEIHAVGEGSIVQTENVLLQIKNTDPRLAWLPCYLETALLRAIWYPTAVATNSYFCKKTILSYLQETGTPEDVEFKLHDFGARGVSSFESAGIGASAHLLSFSGTDTISGALFAREFYFEKMAGFSIPSAEHGTIISWGQEREFDAYANMVEQFGEKNFACVIDSYDAMNAIGLWGRLFDAVKNRGGRVILRPDSGNPVAMAALCIEKMMEIAGFELNSLGYRVLPPHVRLIYGDGINPRTLEDVLSELKMRKISADNIAFGMGGALLQHLDRDTLRFAMKVNAVSSDGAIWHDVSKNPSADPTKRSKSGRLALVRCGSLYKTIKESALNGDENELKAVFRNGEILQKTTFAQIKSRIKMG